MSIVNLKDFKASLNKPKYTTEPKPGRNLYRKNLVDKLEFFNNQISVYLSDPIIEKCEFSAEGCAIKFISIEENIDEYITAIYGMAAEIPDKSIIKNLVNYYLDMTTNI